MKVRHYYIALCLLGILLPYSQLIPFLREHGLNVPLLLQQLFANRISSFFGLDVIVAAFALWVGILVDRRRIRLRHAWVPLLGTMLVGVSLGLPLWLYLRELHPSPDLTGRARLANA
jgi:Terpene cyclase DEP1